jgi:hypothetical protein
MKNHTEVRVKTHPPCDICGAPAYFDAKSKDGRWGYFCPMHFQSHTWGKLGLGMGQRLISDAELEKNK